MGLKGASNKSRSPLRVSAFEINAAAVDGRPTIRENLSKEESALSEIPIKAVVGLSLCCG